ncbi:glycosyltransferase family 39 protein [Candidatus Woesearchaeota archaeon]|nr:glycosyltransferase family 39 protein [Candidatus Woesearchaeota archaeon]
MDSTDSMSNKQAYIVLAILAIIFVLLSLLASSQKGLTNDEIVHITAGYSYWKTFDFRLNTEHPPLIKLVAGAPLFLLDANLPLNDEHWVSNKEWQYAAKFFFLYNDNASQLLSWARVPMVLVALLGLLYVFWYAQAVYGNAAALLASTLYAFSPSLVGHAPLVTTDVGVMVFSFITVYYLRRFCEHRTRKYLVAAGIGFGLALASKYSAIYLIPTLFFLAVGYEWCVRENKQFYKLKSFWSLCVWMGVIISIGLAVVAFTYGIKELPKFAIGLGRVIYHGETGHRAFLLGDYSENGWLHYFLVAFLVKEPIALTIFLLLAAYATYSLWSKDRAVDELFILIPALAFIAAFSLGKIDIGIRHIFPAYPFLFVFVSKIVHVRWSRRVKQILIGALVVWYVVSSLLIFPHFLAYFNEVVGPQNGYKVLMDSNVDWGQDLKSLANYLHKRNDPLVKMAYFGTDSREYYNVTWTELKCGPQDGFIAISVNLLNGFTNDESKCSSWLKSFSPIDTIGYSIFVYNLSADDVAASRNGYCKEKCREKCRVENLVYAQSSFNESCRCRCV